MSGLQRRQLLGAVGALGTTLLAACAPLQPNRPSERFLALPQLNTNTALRVVYAHNPRYDRPASDLVDRVMTQTQALCQAHFALTLQMAPMQEVPISQLFSAIPPAMWDKIKPLTYDFAGGRTRETLVKEMQRSVQNNKSPIAAQIQYARAHLLSDTQPTDARSLARALIDTQLARFKTWQALQGSDGLPLLDGSIYNEYYAWITAPRVQPWPAEIVITNQLLASVEYQGNTLHSALRGGVSNGLTCVSPASRYGTVSVLSLFPFTDQAPLTRQLRGDVEASAVSATSTTVMAAAAMLTHELGHQLLHLGHPFGHTACVMNPPELLQFEAWVKGLYAAECPLGNHAENTLGAERFVGLP